MSVIRGLPWLLPMLILCVSCHAQDSPTYPDSTWMRFSTPEEAGWSSEAIAGVRTFADSLGSDAVMLVCDGAVVAAWGAIERGEGIASIRKTLFGALFGLAVHAGEIDTSATLGELGINDDPPLLETEKQARVIDLLSSSSGVYHEAPAEAPSTWKPERGSVSPGEQWFYNNWDYSALGTIYEQETGRSVFEAFDAQVAEPIGMEDWSSGWGHVAFQPWRSNHGAHSFRMSARDMARFGLLYLHGGRWKEMQVIPSEWVATSTRPVWQNVYGEELPLHFGLAWWRRGGEFERYDAFFASGTGNQSIWILPRLDLVFVHRASAEYGVGVNGLQVEEILLRLIKAKTHDPEKLPELIPLRNE